MSRVVLGVGGGIAAYKAADLVRKLVEAGDDVTVVPTESALKFAGDWADFEDGGRAKIKAMSDHEVYALSPAQVAEWRKATEPLEKVWADGVKKAGLDPDATMKELKASLTKYNAAY